MLAIVSIIGWALWFRVPAGTTAEAVDRTAAPAAQEPVERTTTAEQPDTGFVGPIPDPKSDPPASRPARRVRPNAPLVVGTSTAPPLPAANTAAAVKAPDAEAPAASNAPTAARLRELGSGLTYSVADADVTPPIAITPQLQAMLMQVSPGIRVDVLTIAVIVNEHGTVDSVRAVNLPANLGESVMLTSALSAVKSWRFRPAVKDGAPVRYREIVPVRIRGLIPQ